MRAEHSAAPAHAPRSLASANVPALDITTPVILLLIIGAIRRKPGCIEMAEGDTILLDEIGELSRCLQLKLLRGIFLLSIRNLVCLRGPGCKSRLRLFPHHLNRRNPPPRVRMFQFFVNKRIIKTNFRRIFSRIRKINPR